MQLIIQVQHMLPDRHPIPARSPAEREGQSDTDTRTEGGREGDREELEEEEKWTRGGAFVGGRLG